MGGNDKRRGWWQDSLVLVTQVPVPGITGFCQAWASKKLGGPGLGGSRAGVNLGGSQGKPR